MSMQQPLHKYHCQQAQETAGETVQELFADLYC